MPEQTSAGSGSFLQYLAGNLRRNGRTEWIQVESEKGGMVLEKLQKLYPKADLKLISQTSVGASVSGDITRDAFISVALSLLVILIFWDVFYLVDEFFDFGGNCQVGADVFVVCVHEEAAHDAIGEAAAGHNVDDCRLIGIASGRGHDQFDGFHFVGLEELGDVLVGF